MTTRMIERWFPCAEVSKHSAKGWGSGLSLRRACSLGSHPVLTRTGEGSRHLLPAALARRRTMNRRV